MRRCTIALMALILSACSTAQPDPGTRITMRYVQPASYDPRGEDMRWLAERVPAFLEKDLEQTGITVATQDSPGVPLLTVTFVPDLFDKPVPADAPPMVFHEKREVTWFRLDYTLSTTAGSRSGSVLAVGPRQAHGNEVIQSAVAKLRRELLKLL